MITLTREEAQQVLDALEGSIDAQEWEIDDHITTYGEWYRPQRVEYMKKQLADTNSTIETLRTRLAQPEPYKQPEDNRLLMQAYRAIHEKQPEPEPVAWRFRTGTWWNREVHWRYVLSLEGTEGLQGLEPLYTAPPQRDWQGLTHEEKMEILTRSITAPSRIDVAEAMLKEKNNG